MSIQLDSVVGTGTIPPTMVLIRAPANRGPILTHTGGAVSFDLLTSEAPNDTVELTQYAVEDGSKATDHSRESPSTVSLELAIGNRQDWLDGDLQVEDWDFFSYGVLVDVIHAREVVTIITPLRVYRDWVITGLKTTRTSTTGQAIDFTIELTELIVGYSELVEVPSSILAALRKKKGGKQTGIQCTPQQRQGREASGGPQVNSKKGGIFSAATGRDINDSPTQISSQDSECDPTVAAPANAAEKKGLDKIGTRDERVKKLKELKKILTDGMYDEDN